MRPLGLAKDDAQGAADVQVVSPSEQQLGTAHDHRERIVQLVASPRREFGQGAQLAVA